MAIIYCVLRLTQKQSSICFAVSQPQKSVPHKCKLLAPRLNPLKKDAFRMQLCLSVLNRTFFLSCLLFLLSSSSRLTIKTSEWAVVATDENVSGSQDKKSLQPCSPPSMAIIGGAAVASLKVGGVAESGTIGSGTTLSL